MLIHALHALFVAAALGVLAGLVFSLRGWRASTRPMTAAVITLGSSLVLGALATLGAQDLVGFSPYARRYMDWGPYAFNAQATFLALRGAQLASGLGGVAGLYFMVASRRKPPGRNAPAVAEPLPHPGLRGLFIVPIGTAAIVGALMFTAFLLFVAASDASGYLAGVVEMALILYGGTLGGLAVAIWGGWRARRLLRRASRPSAGWALAVTALTAVVPLTFLMLVRALVL